MLRMIERAEREEAVAHALFDLTQTKGRLVQVHEIVAMIEPIQIRFRARGELKEDAPMDDFVNPDKSGGAGSAKTGDAAVIFLRQLRPEGPWMLLAIDPESGKIEAKTIENTDGVRSFVAKHNGNEKSLLFVEPNAHPHGQEGREDRHRQDRIRSDRSRPKA